MFKEQLTKTTKTLRQSFIGDWYYGHNQRDQRILRYLLVVVLIFLFWLLCIKPVTDWNFEQKTSAANAYRVLSIINSHSNQLKGTLTEKAFTSAKHESLIPIITKTAGLRKIQLNRLQPDSDTSVTVFIENQSFNSIIKWIAQLEENNRVVVNRLNIESDEATNNVTAQISFVK